MSPVECRQVAVQSSALSLDSQLSLDKELYMLNKEMETMQLECETIAARHAQRSIDADAATGAAVVAALHTTNHATVDDSESEHIYETIADCTDVEEPI